MGVTCALMQAHASLDKRWHASSDTNRYLKKSSWQSTIIPINIIAINMRIYTYE